MPTYSQDLENKFELKEFEIQKFLISKKYSFKNVSHGRTRDSLVYRPGRFKMFKNVEILNLSDGLESVKYQLGACQTVYESYL